MKNEDSLVARILNAKYYANSDFMEAQLGSNPSCTWRSILEGRVVLEKGLLWRVGSDANIKLSDSPSVPNAPNFKVQLNNQAPKGIEWV